MRIRNLAVTITLTCAALGAAWSPFAWQTFMESFSHAWDPGYRPDELTAVVQFFSLTSLLVMPLGLSIGKMTGSDAIGFAIGGGIEGALLGAGLSLMVATFAGRRTSSRTLS